MGISGAVGTGIAAGVAVLLAALPLGASASSGRQPCTARGAHVVARVDGSLLLTASTGGDDEYGPGTRVMTCRRGHRRVTLVSTGAGDAISVAHPAFTPGYVAFAFSTASSACTKYLGDDPQCFSTGVTSYNRRTGRRRASGQGAADALVATPAGWMAWLSPADPAGARTLKAVDAGGERVLATGPIDAASLTVVGAIVSWSAAGVPGSATLG